MARSVLRCAFLAVAGVVVGACGGGGSPTEGGGGTEIRTFAGTTQADGPGSCSGDSHVFTAGAGTITVTLLQSTDNTPLVAQICAGGIDDNHCSLNQTMISVGQTLTGVRQGISTQALVLQPLTCSPAGGPVPPGPISYTASVTYRR